MSRADGQGGAVPSRPYLYRALIDWVVDNGWTPHVVVDATDPEARVPAAFVQDGRITLNLSPTAVRDYHQDHEALSFSARFAGQPHSIHAPMRAVLAVFARETGQGMMFGAEPGHETLQRPDDAASSLQAVDPQRPFNGSRTGASGVDGPKVDGPGVDEDSSASPDSSGASSARSEESRHDAPADGASSDRTESPAPGSGPKSKRARFKVVK